MDNSTYLLRLTAANYADGASSLVTGADPVSISQIVFDQDGLMPNQSGISDLFVSWGQFIDHDLSLTPDSSGEHVFVQGLVAPLERSIYDTDLDGSEVRQHVNVVSPAMDASQIYGSDSARETLVRAAQGGQLRMGEDGLMELTTSDMAGASEDRALFLAGDVRANENTGLTSLHILFSMEHNHWADRIADLFPERSDEEIFQTSRAIVEYELQTITYNEWLPLLIGDAIGPDEGYDATVDARISAEFSTAGFRFGHTMVSPTIGQIEEDGTASVQGDIRVQDAFFNISQIQENGIDDIIRGMTAAKAQMSDAVLIDDLNFFLTSPAGVSGFSLAALNILRGRDHGLDTYVEVRAALLGDIDPETLDPADFSIITSNAATQAKLAQVYASVLDVDLWVGGLAEDDVPGGQLGPIFTHIVADQFTRTRAADDTFGDLPIDLDPAMLAEIAGVSLSDIVLRNTGITHAQDNLFVAMDRVGGSNANDTLEGSAENELILGFDGDDRLYGRAGDDALHGGMGRDFLQGNIGNDTLHGGDGNDMVIGAQDDDVLFGEDGNDEMHGGIGQDHMQGGAGNDLLRGGDDADRMFGGIGSDRMYGDAGDDLVDGGAGNDRLHGVAGDDTLTGGEGDDHLFAGLGNDHVFGNEGRDALNGGDGQDTLEGGAGVDRLFGQDGDDTLDGGAGHDMLFGGTGRDLFQFSLGNEVDIVRDFDITADVVSVSGIEGISSFDALMVHAYEDIRGVSFYFDSDILVISDLTADLLTSEHFSFG